MTSPCGYFAQKHRTFFVFAALCFAKGMSLARRNVPIAEYSANFGRPLAKQRGPVWPYQGAPRLDPAAGGGGPVGSRANTRILLLDEKNGCFSVKMTMMKIQDKDVRRRRCKKNV